MSQTQVSFAAHAQRLVCPPPPASANGSARSLAAPAEPGVGVDTKPWLPFIVHHGERLIGVYWGATPKEAAAFARMESRSFGPVDLTGKRLDVVLHAAVALPMPVVRRS